jgi:hypothetical protein
MRLHGLPAASAIQLHPVIFSIFHFAGVFESLSKQVAAEVIVRSILESQVANVAEILIEFL